MRTCLRKVPSGERLEFAVAQSPGNMKVSVQAARSIDTGRAAAGVEDGRKFATRSRCVKLTSQCPHRAPLMPSFPAANRRMGLIDRFSSPMTPARQVICSSGWQESLIGGARRIVRRLRPVSPKMCVISFVSHSDAILANCAWLAARSADRQLLAQSGCSYALFIQVKWLGRSQVVGFGGKHVSYELRNT
jgi:hypothetical protein